MVYFFVVSIAILDRIFWYIFCGFNSYFGHFLKSIKHVSVIKDPLYYEIC